MTIVHLYVDDLPEVGCGGEVEAHASQVDGRVGEEEQARGDLGDRVQASDEETELDENARDENGNNWVALVGASGDEVKEEAEDVVLSDGADQPACADQVAEGGGPGGEDHPDEDEAVPEGELGHVEAVVEQEGGGAGQRCEQGEKQEGGKSESAGGEGACFVHRFLFLYLLNPPLGIEKPGFFSSPERFAPAMTPVTPEKTTPKTVKKFTCKGKHDILLKGRHQQKKNVFFWALPD